MPDLRRLALPVAALAVVLAAAGCSGSAAPRRTVTRYVDPSPAPATTSAGATSSSTSAAAEPPAPAELRKLPGTCDDLLPQAAVENTINETLNGDTDFVVGQPDPSIHRVTYLNCRYGLTSPSATPAVEIQVSLYGTSAQAAARIAPTVSDYGAHGATAQNVTADGLPAKMLTGGSGAGYTEPTLVLAFGQRTVAISLGPDIAASRQQADLSALAALAVRKTQ